MSTTFAVVYLQKKKGKKEQELSLYKRNLCLLRKNILVSWRDRERDIQTDRQTETETERKRERGRSRERQKSLIFRELFFFLLSRDYYTVNISSLFFVLLSRDTDVGQLNYIGLSEGTSIFSVLMVASLEHLRSFSTFQLWAVWTTTSTQSGLTSSLFPVASFRLSLSLSLSFFLSLSLSLPGVENLSSLYIFHDALAPPSHSSFQHDNHLIHVTFQLSFIYLKTQVNPVLICAELTQRVKGQIFNINRCQGFITSNECEHRDSFSSFSYFYGVLRIVLILRNVNEIDIYMGAHIWNKINKKFLACIKSKYHYFINPCKFLTPALADDLSLGSERQQVSSGLREPSH